MSKIKLDRKTRIQMFLADYYLGPTPMHQFAKILIGPILLYVGFILFFNSNDRLMIIYGGLTVLFGSYYTIKPFIWLLTKWEQYEDAEIDLELTERSLTLKEKNKSLQLNLSTFRKIQARKTYYSLLLENERKLYLPKRSLTNKEQVIIEKNIKN